MSGLPRILGANLLALLGKDVVQDRRHGTPAGGCHCREEGTSARYQTNAPTLLNVPMDTGLDRRALARPDSHSRSFYTLLLCPTQVSFEPKNMPSVVMSDDYGMSVLIKHNASLVGVIYGGGEAVFNNTVLNASVVDEIYKFVCRLADDSDGRYIDYLLKHDVRVCPFCAVQDARCRGTCSGCTSWKEAMFNAKPCTDPCISTLDDDAVTRLLVKASPVLSLMIEDESDDEDAAHQVMNVVKGMHSIEDIRTLALFIVRFGISMQNGTHIVLNKSKFKWTTDGKTEDEVARSRAFIDAVLSVVGETPRAAHSDEIASFVRCVMDSVGMRMIELPRSRDPTNTRSHDRPLHPPPQVPHAQSVNDSLDPLSPDFAGLGGDTTFHGLIPRSPPHGDFCGNPGVDDHGVRAETTVVDREDRGGGEGRCAGSQ